MKRHKILIINAAGYMGGDIIMFLLGLPYLTSNDFEIFSVSIPRGKVFETIKALPNTQVIPMELGGKELTLPSQLSLPRRLGNVASGVLRSAALVRRENIEIIYTVDRTVGMAISYLVSRITCCPLILNANIWHYLGTSFLHRQVIKHAARITVSSEEMRKQFLPYVHAPLQLVKILNAIKVENFDPRICGDELRMELNIPFDSPVIVLAGRLTPYKGQEEFIRAAEIVLKKRPETYFLIAGTEDIPGYQLFLEQLIRDFGIGDRAKLIGYREDIARLFACSDIVTMPSHAEAFGLVALEAMAMKKPVIATNAGAVPEFLVDGEMGLLIPPRDPQSLSKAIITLIDNPEMAKTMGEKGREQVISFYNDRIYGQEIVELFCDVIAHRSSH